MKHGQILDKLAAKTIVQAINEDLSRLCRNSDPKNPEDKEWVLKQIFLRWNCVINDITGGISEIYKSKTILALVTTLHKFGYAEKEITQRAINAIQHLNDTVALSDDFFRKSDAIKELLQSEPEKQTRKPALPESITFFRPKDVIAIQLNNKFYAAYIHSYTRINESPVLEFYDGVFNNPPTIQDLENCPAKGRKYKNGVAQIAKYAVYGMKYLPDPANQITLIAACIETPPTNAHLEKPSGLYSVSDIFDIQETIQDYLFDDE